MNQPGAFSLLVLLASAVGVLLAGGAAGGQETTVEGVPVAPASRVAAVAANAVSPLAADEWRRMDESVQRALGWLAGQQQADGSFPTLPHGQPGVTSLCVLAFAAHGHHPGEGPYGQRIERAIDFIAASQKENGLVARLAPEGPTITPNVARHIGESAVYNHAISSLALSEMYGMSQLKRADAVERAIGKALAATLAMQRWPKDLPHDRGGWRYVTDDGVSDSDLSITGWQLMFLRSARNAGFAVPADAIDDAVGYVRRTFDAKEGAFAYTVAGDQGGSSRAMAGAGALALGHAGFHRSAEAARSGEWLLRNPLDDYNGTGGRNYDRYHYSLFNSCQGMYQLGGAAWEQFFPRTVRALLPRQRADGSWDAESNRNDRLYGNSYTTALVILSLGAPNELLPIFQR